MKAAFLISSLPAVSVVAHKVGAIYFGQWHETDINNALHGPGWTEWSLVTHATPRYENHYQPNLPLDNVTGFGPSHPENDATNMAAKIDAAKKNGVDFFMFDWYWYAHPMFGPDGYGTFLGGPLEDGFLKAPNNEDLEFCLMWANQDWVDIHPAKYSWHNTYRPQGPSPNPPLQPTKNGKSSELMVFDGYLGGNSTIAQAGLDYIVDNYLSKKTYLRVATVVKDSSGASSVQQCCFFSFYQLEYLLWGFGEDVASSLLDGFHNRVANQGASNPDACQCLHLSSMQDHPGKNALSSKMDGFSDYGWMKTVNAQTWPETPYQEVMDAGVKAWTTRTAQVAPALYAPPISVAWDSSPRTLPTDPFLDQGYPWGAAWHSSPEQWKSALEQARTFLDERCSANFDTGIEGISGEDYCPPLLMNAWNEWSEGAYLEPDERYGFAKMEAIGQVFASAKPELKV